MSEHPLYSAIWIVGTVWLANGAIDDGKVPLAVLSLLALAGHLAVFLKRFCERARL